jgi:hypothetical protein
MPASPCGDKRSDGTASEIRTAPAVDSSEKRTTRAASPGVAHASLVQKRVPSTENGSSTVVARIPRISQRGIA